MANPRPNQPHSFQQAEYAHSPQAVNIPAHLLPSAYFEQQNQNQSQPRSQNQNPNPQDYQGVNHQPNPNQNQQRPPKPYQQAPQPYPPQGAPNHQQGPNHQQNPNPNHPQHHATRRPPPTQYPSQGSRGQHEPQRAYAPPLNHQNSSSNPITPVNQQSFDVGSPYSMQDYHNPVQSPLNSVQSPAKSLPYPSSPSTFQSPNKYGETVSSLDPKARGGPYETPAASYNRHAGSQENFHGPPRGQAHNPQSQNPQMPPGQYKNPQYPHPNGYNGAPPPQQQHHHQQPQHSQPPQAHPQQRTRKPTPGAPSQTDQRRIVSTSNIPTYSNSSSGSTSSLQNGAPNEVRTKSLSSTSLKHSQPSQSRLYSIPQHQQQPAQQASQNTTPQYQNSHRPSSSGNGSSSSLQHTFSLSSKSRSFSSISKLSSSLSTMKLNSSASSANIGKLQRNVSAATTKTLVPMPKKPAVYPAMLSEVAKIFKEAIILTINTKDGLEYRDTFTGKMSVDIICRIIRTNDRNLALLLGRSLDAQKFFRDVTYNHRLRDSVHEVYEFNHVYSNVEFYDEEGTNVNSGNNSKHGSFLDNSALQQDQLLQQQLPSHADNLPYPADNALPSFHSVEGSSVSLTHLGNAPVKEASATQLTGVNGVFTILTDCYSPTCSRNRLCYSIACPRRLEQQARLNLKPQGGLKRAVSRLSLHEKEETQTLWHETVPQSVLDKLDKQEKMRQELIYEFIYTERDYVKDLEFMTDFYIMPLRNPANNIIPEHQRETFIHTVFGGVGDLLRLAKSFSESLTRRQQQQKPVIDAIADVFLDYVGNFEPFIRYSGNKVFASFEHERQQQVNMKYARFLDAIEKKPESRKQDLSSFLIKGVQRPARYQLLLSGIIKNTNAKSPDFKNLQKAKEEIEKVLVKINIQTGESTDRHKIMVLHRLLGKQTLENRYNFKLAYSHRIIYQVTLNRKRDNEKIDLYMFEHAILLVKHKIQNKREQHKVFEKPIYLPLLFLNSGYDIPTMRSIVNNRYRGSLLADPGIRNKLETNYIGTTTNSNAKLQLNFLGLGSNQVHASLYAEDVTIQNQVLQQVHNQQKKLIEQNDLFSLYKFETRRFHGNNKINCAVPCYGGKKLLYGTDSGVWVSTVRSISASSNEKICSDPTMVISKTYVTQIEVLVEYSKLLILSDKSLYEFDLSCTDSLDHVKNTKSGKMILDHISFFKIGVCDEKLLVVGAKTGSTHSISIFEPANPFDRNQQRNKNRRYDIQEVTFASDPISISFLKKQLVVGCAKGFETLSIERGLKEPILDEADPSLDFAIQREAVTPLAIHKLGRDFLVCYAEFVFLINRNGWRTNHHWDLYWEGNPQNVALFFPYLLSFEPGFIEIRDLHSTNLLRALVGENIRFLHSNEHEAMYACEENGYDIIVSIDFLNLKPNGSSP